MSDGASPIPQPSDEDELVEIVSIREEWNEYTLTNGDKLRMKPVIIEIRKSKIHKDVDGNPLLFMKSQIITDVRKAIPKNLPKKKGAKL